MLAKIGLMNLDLDVLRRELAKHPEILLCVVFGSVAAGKQSPASDIDIGVASSKPLTAEQHLDLVLELSLALKREVDLVDLLTVRGPIVAQILTKGVVVRNEDKVLYAKLMSRMLFDEADWMPYYRRILRARRERFFHGQ